MQLVGVSHGAHHSSGDEAAHRARSMAKYIGSRRHAARNGVARSELFTARELTEPMIS